MNDDELLRSFVRDGSEDAFGTLVERHGGLVYSVAMRQLRHPHQAEEVAHAVFTALARKAAGLSSGTVLAGWLFRATRFAVAKLQRDEERRQRREQEAAMLMTAELEVDSGIEWERIVPVLDAELETLGDTDRSAVLLRFFENRSFREVGEALGASEDAAKMRVSRALNKLRQRFLKRGVTLSVVALTAALSSKTMASSMIAPPGFARSVTQASLSKASVSYLAQAVLRRVVWWKWKPLLITAGAALVASSIAFAIWLNWNHAPKIPAATPAWPAGQ